MKKLTLQYSLAFSLFAINCAISQTVQKLPVVFMNENISTHFVSKQIIDYSDMSTTNVTGDLPMDNIVRVRPKKPSTNLGVLTIVGEGFFLQFKMVYTPNSDQAQTRVDIDDISSFATDVPASATSNYNNPNFSLTSDELKSYALMMHSEKPTLNNVVAKAHKFVLKLNNIWVVDDFIFFDYTAKNKTNLPYAIDEIRYKVVDKKLVKAESNQDQELFPKFRSNTAESFDKEFRNIVAIKKFTFPEDKSFTIQIVENQLSGRTVTLHVGYSDILNAKTFKTEK